MQAAVAIGHGRPQIRMRRLELGDRRLVLGHDRQQDADELPQRQGRGGPVRGGDPGRGRRAGHAPSRRGVGAAGKWGESRGRAAAP